MASISSCTAPSASLFISATKPINSSSSSSLRLSSRFLGTRVGKLGIRVRPSNGSRATCWFKFGKNGVDGRMLESMAASHGLISTETTSSRSVFTSRFLNILEGFKTPTQIVNNSFVEGSQSFNVLCRSFPRKHGKSLCGFFVISSSSTTRGCLRLKVPTIRWRLFSTKTFIP